MHFQEKLQEAQTKQQWVTSNIKPLTTYGDCCAICDLFDGLFGGQT